MAAVLGFSKTDEVPSGSQLDTQHDEADMTKYKDQDAIEGYASRIRRIVRAYIEEAHLEEGLHKGIIRGLPDTMSFLEGSTGVAGMKYKFFVRKGKFRSLLVDEGLELSDEEDNFQFNSAITAAIQYCLGIKLFQRDVVSSSDLPEGRGGDITHLG